VAVYRALSDAQRRLRDLVCQRRTSLEDRLRLLAQVARETGAERSDVDVVRAWLFDVHGHQSRRQSC
jgi:hypothetical protein